MLRKLFCSILLVGSIVLFSQSAFCQFIQSDVEGKWKTFTFETDSTYAAIGNATLSFDANGSLVNSSIYNTGSLNINSDGIITGNLENSTTSIDITKAKMNNDKNIIDGAFTTSDGSYGRADLIKQSSNKTISDLQGKWKLINYEASDYDTYLSYGYVQFDDAGKIVDSSYQYTDGSTGSFTSASISIDNKTAELSGDLTNSQGGTIFVDNGQIDSNKHFIIISYTTSVNTFGIAYLVKFDGSFSSDDLGAKWHLTQIEDDGYNFYATYGNAKLDNDGNLLSGDYNNLGSDSGSFTSGSIDINSDGEISGSITNDKGGKSNLIDGKITSSKGIGIYAFETDYGSAGGGVMIRGEVVPENDDSDDGSSGGGGSGGCVMNPQASFDYAWFLLLIIPVFMLRMRKS